MKTHGYLPRFWSIIVLCLLLLIGGITLAIIAPGNFPPGLLTPVSLMAPACIILLPFFTFIQKKKSSAIAEHFAEIMGYSFAPGAPWETLKGNLSAMGGHDKTLSNVLSGTFAGKPIRLSKFSFAVGYGKNEHRYSFGVAEITFHDPLPCMQLFSAKNVYETANLLENGLERIVLEGDFNKYFSLYAPKGPR